VASSDVWSDFSRAEMFAILAQLAKQTVLAYGNESKLSALLVSTQQNSRGPSAVQAHSAGAAHAARLVHGCCWAANLSPSLPAQ
jgi:uncharacterized protein with PIN domain